jgi:hypothetical protein
MKALERLAHLEWEYKQNANTFSRVEGLLAEKKGWRAALQWVIRMYDRYDHKYMRDSLDIYYEGGCREN